MVICHNTPDFPDLKGLFTQTSKASSGLKGSYWMSFGGNNHSFGKPCDIKQLWRGIALILKQGSLGLKGHFLTSHSIFTEGLWQEWSTKSMLIDKPQLWCAQVLGSHTRGVLHDWQPPTHRQGSNLSLSLGVSWSDWRALQYTNAASSLPPSRRKMPIKQKCYF